MFTSLYLSKYLNLVQAMDSKHPVIEKADFFQLLSPNWFKTENLYHK